MSPTKCNLPPTGIGASLSEDGSAERTFDAWVIPSENASGLLVATLELDERWIRAFRFEKAEARRLAVAAVPMTLAKASQPQILCAGQWAFDQYAVEAVVEAAPSCGVNEVLLPEASGLPVAPVTCLGVEAARRLSNRYDIDYSSDLKTAIEWLGEQKGIVIRTLPMQASFWSSVSTPEEARAATWGLLRRLQYRPGGLVAIYLNRPISIRFSRMIVNTGITPNQTTLAAFAVGLVGVAMLIAGGYAWAVLGTFLLHVNSIWDGIDGELARSRYQTSEFGAYLDSVCDEILNAAIIMTAGYHIAVYYPDLWGIPDAKWWMWMGLFGGGGAFLYALTHWHCKSKHGLGFYWWWEAYKPRKQVQRSTAAWFYFKKLFCKDSILLLFFVAAVFQFMHVLVLASAIMGVVNLVLLFIHIVILRARW